MTSKPADAEPARGETLRARVSRELTAAVVSGELAAGTLVTAPTLAVQFGVSATPVREALLELEKRGFVEAVKNKGFRVTEVGSRELAELAEVRLLLEPPAMHRLAGHLALPQVARFRALAAAMTTAIADADLTTWLDADLRFHLGLTELLGNSMLVTVIGDLRGRTRLVGLAGMLASRELARSAEEHHELVDRLATGDAAGAEQLMRTHIGHTVGWWSGRVEAAPAELPTVPSDFGPVSNM